jgi:hypothetical protein
MTCRFCSADLVSGNFTFNGSNGTNVSTLTSSHSDANSSFDVRLTVTSSAATGSPVIQGNNLGHNFGGDNDIDTSGEDFSFSIEIINFVDNTGGLVSLSDLTFTGIRAISGNGSTDSGTFQIAGNSHTWIDANTGTDFTGHDISDQTFDLLLVNSNATFTNFDYSFNGGDGHRLDNLGYQLDNSVSAVPEPSAFIFLGILCCIYGRQRSFLNDVA